MISLTKTTPDDLESLFAIQTTKEGIWMAAFTPEDPYDKEAYLKKWTAILEKPDIRMQTIRLENKIIGSVCQFEMFEATHVAYWIDQHHWGKGFTTEALRSFIGGSDNRPLFARVAWDNYGSQKVLEKCGFKSVGKDRGFANARKMEIEEIIYRLE